MKEKENIPDRAQRERELYELRAKGLATNQVQKFEDRKKWISHDQTKRHLLFSLTHVFFLSSFR
jgi:hypothetical protein